MRRRTDAVFRFRSIEAPTRKYWFIRWNGAVMAELTGRKRGYSKGTGGSVHMFSKEKAFYGNACSS
jgi:TPP-dependent pyruvate/acetoin dehydrogenase alpha subunit